MPSRFKTAATFNRPSLPKILGGLSRYPATTLSTLLALAYFPFLHRDYRTYLSYGPGGLPYNLLGWLLSTVLLRVLSRDVFSTSIYNQKDLPFRDEASYFNILGSNGEGNIKAYPPPRTGGRPVIGPHPVPQRQISQLPEQDVRKRFVERFEKLGRRAEEMKLVEVKQSVHERQHAAIFVARRDGEYKNVVARETRGEIAHIHAGLDGSLHVLLSPIDCKIAIMTGWGQRHALDGVKALKHIAGFTMPVNYMLIYAPRTDEEIDVALSFIKAGIRFMVQDRNALN